MRTLITIIVACMLLFTQSVVATAEVRPVLPTFDLASSITPMHDQDCCVAEVMDHSKSRCASDCSIAMFGIVAMVGGDENSALDTQSPTLLRAIVLSLNGPPPISATK